eukprot:m.22487 g.22487  ORF g.22487 m.22487 type:complete len:566 (-) comp7403_c0_seq1:53-1750(-)
MRQLILNAARRTCVSTARGRMLSTESNKDKLVVFDTTLRDGEQSPGVTLQTDQKLVIARALSRLGVTVCEAGFPIASLGDFEAVQRIAREIGPLTAGRVDGKEMIICGLARCKEEDIDRCFEAIHEAPRHRIHTFLATSDIHLEHKLNISRAQCLEQIHNMVSRAASHCSDIEFSPEDAGRSDHAFLVQALEVAIEAGASTLNIPDTVGFNLPGMYGKRIRDLIKDTKGSGDVIWSTHCHDDLGLATANTLSGIEHGCRQVEVTINGLGERAGNTALEEVVMAISVHPSMFPVTHDIDTTQLTPVSHTVATLSGMAVQRNKAIVGGNAFAHESGIHQDGVLKHQETYEIMRPDTVGLTNHDNLVLGKLSGRHAFKKKVESLGYEIDDKETLATSFTKFKKVADSKNVIHDGDLHAIMRDVLYKPESDSQFSLDGLTVVSGSAANTCTATVAIKTPEGEIQVGASVSNNGPVDSMFAAIDGVVGLNVEIEDYRTEAVTEGKDSLGEVTVLIREANSTDLFSGTGIDVDVLKASAIAYVNALNSMKSFKDAESDNRAPMKKEKEGLL